MQKIKQKRIKSDNYYNCKVGSAITLCGAIVKKEQFTLKLLRILGAPVLFSPIVNRLIMKYVWSSTIENGIQIYEYSALYSLSI